MTKKPRSAPITQEKLVWGYASCIENAQELMRAAGLLRNTLPAKALALGELGQEELGKSFQILVAFTLPPTADAWRRFWSDWRDHNRKGLAAYFYEWLNPLRIEVDDPAGGRRVGIPLGNPIAAEKEIGFYVDYDHASGVFISPKERVSGVDASTRLLTLLALLSTAVAIHDVLVQEEPEFRFPAFAEIPATLVREFVPQDRVPGLYDAFAQRSKRHRVLIERLRAAFAQSLGHLQELQAQRGSQRSRRDDA